jgi:adenosylcobinamide-GDP ribazoletransferase
VRTGADTSLAGAAGWLVVVGAAIGALAGAVRLGAAEVLGRAPATALAMVALVAVSGALHQDGLADTADALGARGGRDARLRAMRDAATGAYGTLALIAWALLLFATLSPLDGSHGLAALIAAGALGRWAAVLHAASTTPARRDGLGAELQVRPPALVAGTLTALAAALLACGAADGGAVLAAALLCALLSSALARRLFGGRTGDTLGASVAVTEVVVCTLLLALWQG